jgi:hypothetical protein
MLRRAFFILVAFALSIAQAQQVESHGPAASVLSPTTSGTAHGTPASVLSPTPPQTANGRVFFDPHRSRIRFGKPLGRRHPRKEIIPVPIFIPGYAAPDYVASESEEAAASEEYTPDPNAASGTDADALRDAYYRGAHDALARQQADSRYGEHYLDSREKAGSKPAPDDSGASAKPESTEQAPPTVFIFKDGHKLQTQNYAIVGQTLYDLSNNQVHKIQLAEIDLDATKKANDDLGIPLRLP